MIGRLRVTHKLLLIYLLSLVSVAFLVFRLIGEKDVAADFAANELRGSAYIGALRDTVVGITRHCVASTDRPATASGVDLRRLIAGLEAAEAAAGRGLETAGAAAQATTALEALANAPGQAAGAQICADAARLVHALIARVADRSDLIVDPDPESNSLASVVALRLPEILESIVVLSMSAHELVEGSDQASEMANAFILAERALATSLLGLDEAMGTIRRLADPDAGTDDFDTGLDALRRDAGALVEALRQTVQDRTAGDELREQATLLRERAIVAADASWRAAGADLDRLLHRRIDGLRDRMLTDLGAAACISLVVLLLVWYVARQITRPVRELVRVAERVHTGKDYALRASGGGGGELGVLVQGFNTMLDRLQMEAERERDLAARERAAAAQREILETMPVWLAVVRRSDGAILYANRAIGAARECGADGDDGIHLMDRLHESDRERLIGRLGSEDRIDGYEARLLLPGAVLFWVLISARSLTYGGAHCALVVFTPIDDLKRAEMERERLASRLVDAVESLAEGFALYDHDDRLIVCNEPYRDMNEAVRDLLQPGARWVDLARAGLARGQFANVTGREEPWLADRLRDRSEPGKPIEVQLSSGQWLRAVDRRTREGGLVSIRADITEEKLSAERLRTSEAFKSAVINASQDSIVTIDEAGRVLEFNPAAERAFGYTRKQALNRPLHSLIIPERLAEAHRRGLARYLETGASSVIGRRLEIDARRADGTEFPVELAVSEVDLDGRRAFTAFVRDITARRAFEAELARRASMLDAAAYTATKIVSGVDWQRGIAELLRRLGVAAGVSRVTLFEAHRDAGGRLVQSCRYDWADAGLAPLSDDPRYQNMALTGDQGEEVGEWTLRRQRGEVVQATLSETAGYTRHVFEEHGTLSFLSVPIMVSGAWWGFLGFDDCKHERVWTDIEIDVLKTSAALISGAIERARAEERLRVSEQRYALAARGANDGLWDWDMVADTAYFSPRLNEILGLVDGGLGTSPKALFERVSERHAAALRASLEARFARRRQKFEFECQMRHDSGADRWMVWRCMIVYGADGPVRIVGSLHDITERKQAEEKLRESEARFRAIGDDAPVLLDLMDDRQQMVFANRRFLQFCGCSLEEVAGDGWMSFVHPEDLPGLIEFGNRHFERRAASEIEYRMRRHDGEYRWIHETQAVRRTLDGAFAGFVDAIVDVTDRRRAEAEVARQREALHQSEKLTALGSLLAGVAHELNNPLSVVVGQAMLLEETSIDPKVVGRSETIRRAAERCSRIVRTFLTLARRRQPEQRLMSLNATVAMAVELLAYQLRISDIELKLDLAADLPEVLADSDQLHQVITNLIVNAEQALGEAARPRRLTVSTRADLSRGVILLAVADNGPGIGPEIRSRIFEPFFTTKPLGQGTGIGLAMCQNVITAHRGTLSLVDTPGGGATFVVELPLPPGEAPAKPAPAAAEAPRPATARCRVLVVDDEAEIAQTLAEILRAAGHEVETAGNGEQALDQLDRQRFDVILSDLRMPVLDGPGLFAALRERHPAMVERIAFITGDTLSARLGKFLADTGVLCIEKPFTPDDVRHLLAQVMAQPAGAN